MKNNCKENIKKIEFKNIKDKLRSEKFIKYIIYAIAIIFMFLVFYKNIYVINNGQRQWFETFQKDSESLVIGKIIEDKYNVNDNIYGLQTLDNVAILDFETYEIEVKDGEKIITNDYVSQVGLQGIIFSFLHNKLHIPINYLYVLCSFLLAIVLVNICRLLKEKYGNLLASVFYITFLYSPWIVNFARNLYWIEFSWFLPLMLCLLLGKTKNLKLYLPLIFLSVLFKCLCGYEYLSTILLAAVAFFVVDFFAHKEKRKDSFKMILLVGIISVVAFVTAISIHGHMRGNGDIIQGIENIIKQDVMRRTISTNADQFENIYIKNSINASYISVIKEYFDFKTDVILGISGHLFMPLSLASAFIVFYNIIKGEKNAFRDVIMYFIVFVSTLSWLVLGKAHSYIHVHMNYVLWYFGYVQMVLYIIVKFILNTIKKL